jgi:hypothetical protein
MIRTIVTITIVMLLTTLLAACGSGDTGTADSSAASGRANQSANRFTITGNHELIAEDITVLVQSVDGEFNTVEVAPVYQFVQFVEGPLTDPLGTVILYLDADIQAGTHALVDSAETLSEDVTAHGITYVARVNQLNRFYSLEEPGTLTLTLTGDNRISGSYAFTAMLAGSSDEADRVVINGTFQDIQLAPR